VDWCYAPENCSSLGYAVYDEEQRRVESVLYLFGVVSNPYLVIKSPKP
jgi:rRNA processing protein Gar1